MKFETLTYEELLTAIENYNDKEKIDVLVHFKEKRMSFHKDTKPPSITNDWIFLDYVVKVDEVDSKTIGYVQRSSKLLCEDIRQKFGWIFSPNLTDPRFDFNIQKVEV